MSDTKDTNPKDAAATTRLDLSLVPDSAVAFCALAMTEGDLKYGGYNWRVAGVQTSVYIAALRRHVAKFYNGEWEDPKTKVPHLASAMACLAVLIDSYEQGNVNDDRPPRQTASIYDRAEKIVAHLQQIFPRRTLRHRLRSALSLPLDSPIEAAEPPSGRGSIPISDLCLKQEPTPFRGVVTSTPDVGRVKPEVWEVVASKPDALVRWDRAPVEGDEPGDDIGNRR